MKTYRIYQVDAFTSKRFRGNPAGVVINADGLSEQQMLAIARELNNSETAFVLSPTGPDHDVWVRFFTPKAEVPICGHATIAAHVVRAREMQLPSCTVLQKTGAGILPVEVINDAAGYSILMTQGEIAITEPFEKRVQDQIIAALRLSPDELDPRCPIRIASTGYGKVMIGIRRKATLNALVPDFMALCEISRQISCNGYFVFTLDSDIPDVLVHGRMFAPISGVPEDPVTGNANGPLGAYLIQHGLVNHNHAQFRFTAQQGEAMGRAGRIAVIVDIEHGRPVKVKIGGQAIIVFQTAIEMDH